MNGDSRSLYHTLAELRPAMRTGLLATGVCGIAMLPVILTVLALAYAQMSTRPRHRIGHAHHDRIPIDLSRSCDLLA